MSNVANRTRIYTDGWGAYNHLHQPVNYNYKKYVIKESPYRHLVVIHDVGYGFEIYTTNSIESHKR